MSDIYAKKLSESFIATLPQPYISYLSILFFHNQLASSKKSQLNNSCKEVDEIWSIWIDSPIATCSSKGTIEVIH